MMTAAWKRNLAALLGVVSLGAAPLSAEVRSVDPNTAIDADLAPVPTPADAPTPPAVDPTIAAAPIDDGTASVASSDTAVANAGDPVAVQQAAPASATFQRDDLIGAAEGVFGKGAAGLAGIIEDILKKQGEPVAYITGREAAGAFVVGLRYGSGTLHHKIEGERTVYWTGPSIGFDVGGNAASSFVLVYNLYDTQDIYRRYPQGEGAAYFVGGFTASYLRRGDVVLIPVRLGAGVRLGANVGYMKFREKNNWVPF